MREEGRVEKAEDLLVIRAAHDLLGERLKRVPPNGRTRPYPVPREGRPPAARKDPVTGATVYESLCHICNSGCDALIYVKDGKVIRVEGDPNSHTMRGKLCSKGLASIKMLYHPERLKRPLKRVGSRGEGRWQEISWEEALDTIAEKILHYKREFGNHSVVFAQGTSRGWWPYFSRFANATRTQSIGPGIAQCFFPRFMSQQITTGGNFMECPDFERTACVLVWGINPFATWGAKARRIMEARARGAKLIVVDPLLSRTASKADIWLRVRPGADIALALGMLNVIISEGLYDKDFVTRWTIGFEDLGKRAAEFSPEKVEEIAWVPKDKMIQAARLFATTKPACINQAHALETNSDTISTGCAVHDLAYITGNLDVPGGNVAHAHSGVIGTFDSRYNIRHLLTEEDNEMRLGSREYPLLAGEDCWMPTAHAPTVWKAILTGKPYPVKAIHAQGTNPIPSYANSNQVREALKKLEFFSIADLFMTESAELADIVLPAATFFERDMVHDNMQISDDSVHLQQRVVTVEGCKNDFEIMNELAKRLGVGEHFFGSDREAADFLLQDVGISFEEFRKKGIIFAPREYRSYEKKGFNTPSGKVELSSSIKEKHGADPLPKHEEPFESPYRTPDLSRDYPFILSTGWKTPVFRHSELRNIDILKEIEPWVPVMMHPEAAAKLGIKENDRVRVESPRGYALGHARLRADLHPQVVIFPNGWPREENSNILPDNEKCAELIGSTAQRCLLCRVSKVVD